MAIARDEVIGQIEPDGVQQSAEARALAGQLPVNRPPVDSQALGDLFDRATAEGSSTSMRSRTRSVVVVSPGLSGGSRTAWLYWRSSGSKLSFRRSRSEV